MKFLDVFEDKLPRKNLPDPDTVVVLTKNHAEYGLCVVGAV